MGASVPDALLSLDNMEAPKNLQCPLCNKVFKDASLIACCGTSYCDHCIRDRLMEDGFRCPTCGTDNMTQDKLTANKFLREVCPRLRGNLCSIACTHAVLASTLCSASIPPDVDGGGRVDASLPDRTRGMRARTGRDPLRPGKARADHTRLS